jgi:hypothetical protein
VYSYAGASANGVTSDPVRQPATNHRLGRAGTAGRRHGQRDGRHGAIPAAQASAHSGMPSMMPVANTAGREGSGLSSIPP